MAQSWDSEVDVLVVGSGAGGLMAALVAAHGGAQVLVVEKDREWGGTSATSGGGIWIVGSDQARAAGFDDNSDQAFAYVRGLSAANVPDGNIRAYIDHSAPMLRWLTAHTELRYIAQPYPDYHAENPGGSPRGYRTHLPDEFDGRSLGKDIRSQRMPSPAASVFGYLNWTFAETYELLYRTRGWFVHLAWNMAKYWLDWPFRFTSRKDRRLTLGGALTGALRLALGERQVPLWLECPLVELVKEKGKVTGAIVSRRGKRLRIGARKGVVLAAGGFDKDQAMRDAHAPLYRQALYSGGVASNTGDGITAGQAAGAGTMNLQSAWAAPVFYVPGEDRGRLCTMERALPGSIMVSGAGTRYLNEAASYHITGQAMARRQAERGDASPSWLVFDARYRHLYPMGPVYPLIPDWLQSGMVKTILKKAATIAELAGQMGVDAAALAATVARFNDHAARGEDPDFHRGDAAYDRLYGDYRHGPNPCLRPLSQAPFYAMPIHPGDIGMNGGLTTNAKAQVTDAKGKVIPGLYAIGNNAASAMGESYPGAGVTIGPAMTFGYIAARHITGAND